MNVPINLFRAIALKLASALMFALLAAFVRYCGETGVPVGQIVFFRSACAIVPVLIIYAWRNELIWRSAPRARSATSDAARSA